MANRSFLILTWTTLVAIYLVILAGSVVRMTGSGMGCPDWPKCFGYLIPPSESEQVQFSPNHKFEKGQMIIVDDELLRAKGNFTSSTSFNSSDWELYEKHDYATFNATHTWIEYINRLLGALSGLFMLAVFVFSVVLRVKNKLSSTAVVLSFLGVVLLGFQAWLGKVVVDSNLDGLKITAHLFGALALVAVVLWIIRSAMGQSFLTLKPQLKPIAWVVFLFFLVQVFFGTEVRILVDELPRTELTKLFYTNWFKIHRSFSWLVFGATVFLLYKAFAFGYRHFVFRFIGILIFLEVAIGLSLYFFAIPKFAQPLHLLVANLLFACFVWILLARTHVDK